MSTAHRKDYTCKVNTDNVGSEFVPIKVNDDETSRECNYIFATKKDGITYIIYMDEGNDNVEHFLEDINWAKENNEIEWK